MAGFRSFHCTARGNSHVARNTVCQDASASFDGDGIHIAVVSDGHGQKCSFRSDVGSRLAVDLAMEKLKSFALNLQAQGLEALLFSEQDRQKLLRQLARSIVGSWNIQALQHLVEHPITEEEYGLAGSWEDSYRSGDHLLQIFGATLIAAVVTERWLLVLQQGDGRCVVLHESGRVDQPVPWDPGCVGNTTTSLCQEDAVERFRFFVADLRQDRIVACFAVTDGVEDSFADMKDANAYLGTLAGRFAREGDVMESELTEQLSALSRAGSQDDVSVAAIVDCGAAEQMADRLDMIFRFRSQRLEIARAQNKLRSMQRKKIFLKNRYDAALEKAQKLRIRNRRKLAGWGYLQPEYEEELEKAEAELRAARQEYEDYKQTRQVYVDSARQAREQALRLRETLREMHSGNLPGADREALFPDSGMLADPEYWDALDGLVLPEEDGAPEDR